MEHVKFAAPQGPGATPPTDLGEDQVIDLRAVLSAVWRRKWIVVMTTVCFVGLAALYVLQLTPRYAAAAQVMINTRQQTVADVDAVLSGLSLNSLAVESELEVLRSTQLLQRVIDTLRLEADPEFNPTLRAPDRMAALLNWRNWLPTETLAEFGLAPAAPPPPDPLLQREFEQRMVLASVRRNLTVSKEGLSAVFNIRFSSVNPRKAALIANTIADQYIVDQLEAKFDATRRASSWLSERVQTLKTDVEIAEAAVESFREERAIAEGQSPELTTQQLAELNSRLIVAQAERAEAEARYDQILELVQAGNASSAPEVLQSGLIRTLREQEAQVQRRAAELATRYGDRHPEMINVRAELRDLRGAISVEIRKIVEGLRSSFETASARETALAETVSGLEQRMLNQSQTFVDLRQLEREADATRLIYENFLGRFKETTQQEGFEDADARVIANAVPPLTPYAPRRTVIAAAAGVAGVMVGLMMIGLLEYLNNTYQSVGRIQRDTGLPVLASLPRVGRARKRTHALSYIRERPGSQLAECVRNLRTAILMSQLDNPPKVIMVTSATPNEGKSTACMMLAHVSAQLGKSAIIVDCDLRSPTLAETFGITDSAGLTGVLDGSAALTDAMRRDAETGLHVLPTQRTVANAADVLSTQRFANLLADLRERFDLVLLDTPPTLAVTDARIVGARADAVIYAVRWDATPRDAVAEGLRQLTDVGVRVSGLVVTMVDFENSSVRSDPGYGYYGKYTSYYHS